MSHLRKARRFAIVGVALAIAPAPVSAQSKPSTDPGGVRRTDGSRPGGRRAADRFGRQSRSCRIRHRGDRRQHRLIGLFTNKGNAELAVAASAWLPRTPRPAPTAARPGRSPGTTRRISSIWKPHGRRRAGSRRRRQRALGVDGFAESSRASAVAAVWRRGHDKALAGAGAGDCRSARGAGHVAARRGRRRRPARWPKWSTPGAWRLRPLPYLSPWCAVDRRLSRTGGGNRAASFPIELARK